MFSLTLLLAILPFCNLQDTTKIGQNYTLEEVFVTSSRYPKPLKEVPVITRVISKRVIKESGAHSIKELLEFEVPGLEFTQTEGVTNSITFQGLGAKYLLILIDGERMAGETSRSNPDFNRINIDNIERIEIVKGAMSTLYGSGAVAGVINIITKQNESPLFGSGSAKYDGEGEAKYSILTGANFKGIRSTSDLSFRYKNSHFIDNPEAPDSPFESEGYKNRSFMQSIGYSWNKGERVEIRGSLYDHERFNAGEAGKIVRDLYFDKNLIVKANFKTGTIGSAEISLNIDDYDKFSKFLKLDTQERVYSNTIKSVRALENLKLSNSHTILTGAEINSEKLMTYQFDNGKEQSVTQGAIYIQDSYNPSGKLSIETGIRAEYHSEYKFHITPKISLMYRPGRFSLRLGYASGYRSPSLKELYTDWNHQGFFQLMGNSNLKPENSYNISGSAEYTASKINLAVALYHNIINNKIATIWTPGQDTAYYKNVDRSSVSGIDFTSKYEITKSLACRLSYTFVKEWLSADGHNTSSVRPHSAVIILDYRFKLFKREMSSILSGRYQSSVEPYSFDPISQEYQKIEYEGYTIWRASISGEIIKGISIQAGINNIFNYKPNKISYNSLITRGISIFGGITFNIESHR